jgi:hypothetical protein
VGDVVVGQGQRQAQGNLGRGNPVADRRYPGGAKDTRHLPVRCRQRRKNRSSPAGRPDKKKKYEAERYERAAKAAMEIAIKISDELLRDSSVRQIVGLCVQASDLKTARILFRAIQAETIREDVLNDHPMLRQ